jgi:hypothetical protein
MRFELTKFPAHRYSIFESHLFDKLPKNRKRFNSADIVKIRKAMGGEWDVKFPLKNATTWMQRLLEKVDANGEAFQIMKDDKRTGHHVVEYWIQKRKRKNGK